MVVLIVHGSAIVIAEEVALSVVHVDVARAQKSFRYVSSCSSQFIAFVPQAACINVEMT